MGLSPGVGDSPSMEILQRCRQLTSPLIAMLRDYVERSHHFVVFVFQYVAVNYITEPLTRRYDRRAWELESLNDPGHKPRRRFHDVLRGVRLVRIHGLAWASEGKLPRIEVQIRIKRLSIQDEEMDEVYVDRMGVTSCIDEPPDFHVVASGIDC